MEFTLRGGLKKYRRMRRWREIGAFAGMVAGFGAPWFFELNRTETIICWVGAMTWATVVHLEMRLKTLQIRLAGMDDKLDAISGKEPEGSLVLELNDW
jgi:hypothetical protein